MTPFSFRIHFEMFISLNYVFCGIYQPMHLFCQSCRLCHTHASGAGMVSAAVFPFIYCHLVDIYLYSFFPQNTNWFNCYKHHSSILPSTTSIYDNIQQYGFKGFKEILYTAISIPWLELIHFIGHVIFYICHDATFFHLLWHASHNLHIHTVYEHRHICNSKEVICNFAIYVN